VPFKHHAEHRHHIPKPRYRVTNSPEYDAAVAWQGDVRWHAGRHGVRSDLHAGVRHNCAAGGPGPAARSRRRKQWVPRGESARRVGTRSGGACPPRRTGARRRRPWRGLSGLPSTSEQVPGLPRRGIRLLMISGNATGLRESSVRCPTNDFEQIVWRSCHRGAVAPTCLDGSRGARRRGREARSPPEPRAARHDAREWRAPTFSEVSTGTLDTGR
jgi:hypothetical protein